MGARNDGRADCAAVSGRPSRRYFDVAGDDARIDWGYAVRRRPRPLRQRLPLAGNAALESAFIATGEPARRG